MKIAVVGTGSMGRNHIRVLKNIYDVQEIVISDSGENLNIALNKFGNLISYHDYKKLIEKEKPDGAVIATPPATHKDIAVDFMKAGIHVLVEKPIAGTLGSAEAMIETAIKEGVIFTVGHVERFNPVVKKIKDFIDNKFLSNIYIVNTQRIGPFPKRLLGKEVGGVLIDLAVHDFDIIHYLVGEIIKIQSQVIRLDKEEIYIKTLMDLKGGIKASSEFSWISPRYLRTIEIYGDSGMIFGDYLNQEVVFYENDDYDNPSPDKDTFFRHGLVKSGKVIKYPMYKEEPLLLELKNFVFALMGKEEILVKPRDAKKALENACQI